MSGATAGIAATLIVAARAFGVLLFAASAAGKARHFGEFTNAIEGYGLLPSWTRRPAAVSIVACEAAVVMALLSGQVVKAGAFLGIAMLVVFAAAMGLVLMRGGRGIDCGCTFGGGTGSQVSGLLIARNLFFAAILVPAAAWPLQAGSLDPMSLVDGLGFAAACFLLGLLLDQVARLRHARTTLIGGQA